MATQLIPIDCGHITEVERSGQQYFTGFGEKIHAQVIMWLVKGDDTTIVIDTGPGTPEMVRERHGRELVQSPEQNPLRGLEKHGVAPDDVDVVVQTHLHWDHCLGLDQDLFPNAEIYLQRAELAYAAAPYPVHQRLFDVGVLKRLLPSYARDIPNIRIIDGDYRISRDCELLLTPGHTPGTQATIVRTDTTTYAFASDTVTYGSSWRGPTCEDWIPPGIHTNLDEYYESLARLARVADVVVPSHDDAWLDRTLE
ncbi:N-acyl homoserine lactonase family protein [Actinophytocola sp.]|uniref:N-acyl homoserine lactonase family protein n=1 Tax=Actinophytocola sp. TaxID=1872138 RepID=UPI003D6AFEF6